MDIELLSGERYVIGIDFGTNTGRAVVVDVQTGKEMGAGISPYAHGSKGILLDSFNIDVARHHPGDYLVVAREAITAAMNQAASIEGFQPYKVVGIGFDTTASTPIPVDKYGVPIAFLKEFENNLNAMAWLWKDHSSIAEAEEITAVLKQYWPEPLERIGGTYSPEWFWAKLLRFIRVAPEVVATTESWVEIADWFGAWLIGSTSPTNLRRSICIAGHKGLYDPHWGGYPTHEVLSAIDPALVRFAMSPKNQIIGMSDKLGVLSATSAEFLGLPAGIPVGVPGIDAHIGALGSGIKPGRMIKILGTSGVDLMVSPAESGPGMIPGLSGVVRDSIIPNYVTIEAGQNAVGDIYGWFVDGLKPNNDDHKSLTLKATNLKPGETGLLGLDWHNGNRTILIDQRLSGLLVGLNLHTKPEHIYRTLIEATAFGSRIIIERLEEYGIQVDEIIASGGLPGKNTLVMQIFADILNRPLRIPNSEQTAALGAAIIASVVADRQSGIESSIEQAVTRMTSFRKNVYIPEVKNVHLYDELFPLYRALHNAFGTEEYKGNLHNIMKQLLKIRERVTSK